MIKKTVFFIILFLTSLTITSFSANKFPWRKKWNRYELYRMATSYYEAGQAYEKNNKNDKAMHCYMHANKTSPYSDTGAKARGKLRDKYNKNVAEPTVEEVVVWLKKQPDLTTEEKEFIRKYESGATAGTNTPTETTKPEPGPGETDKEPGTGEQEPPATGEQEPEPGTQKPGDGVTPPDNTGKPDTITEDEIKQKGERIKYRDDSLPPQGQ